jgi:hypothetical protein
VPRVDAARWIQQQRQPLAIAGVLDLEIVALGARRLVRLALLMKRGVRDELAGLAAGPARSWRGRVVNMNFLFINKDSSNVQYDMACCQHEITFVL